MTLQELAKTIKETPENIILVYAFNGTGKTRLSVEYKDYTKDAQGNHTGVYYNAFSEDLFVWNNDEEHDNDEIRLEVLKSSLSQLHQYFGDEESIKDKLKLYNPNYNFRFKYVNDNQEEGIEYIWFFRDENPDNWIKISRGEERIFIWCFFLALFDLEDFPDAHKDYMFIDDPVSSLDDTNIYLTAQTLFKLFDDTIQNNQKIIVTTHHIGLFSLLMDWLKKGENAAKYREKVKKSTRIETAEGTIIRETFEEKNRYLIRILENKNSDYVLKSHNRGAWLYHLLLLQKIQEDIRQDSLYLYHLGILRQVLEIIASFVGAGRFGAVLHYIGEPDDIADKINANAHKRTYDTRNAELAGNDKELFIRVFNNLTTHYQFKI